MSNDMEVIYGDVMYYIDILWMRGGKLYTGFTTDLRRRILKHKNGLVRTTREERPLKLIHYEAYSLESDARRREKFLKTTEGKRLLRMQIRDLLTELGYGPVIRQDVAC